MQANQNSIRFSANLGYLWTELPLPEAIRAAARAGFDAVECHWPYETPPDLVAAALAETALPMLSLNTHRGGALDFGISALGNRTQEAREAIDQAIDYAAQTGTRAVHVLAGTATGYPAFATYLDNLQYACDVARPCGITILIEPLNAGDAPGYFLDSPSLALTVIKNAARSNLKLLFDCYHIHLMEGDVIAALEQYFPHIGHIQFASAPDRGPPGPGTIDFSRVFRRIQELGYTTPLGAEYRTDGLTEPTLSWMEGLRAP